MTDSQLIAHCGSEKLTREQLQLIPTPEATQTHQPLAHGTIVEAPILSLDAAINPRS